MARIRRDIKLARALAEAVRENDARLCARCKDMLAYRTKHGPRPTAPPDYKSTAQIHMAADKRCGRPWSCACAACRIVRAAQAEGR